MTRGEPALLEMQQLGSDIIFHGFMWIFLAVLTGLVAGSKGENGFLWFLLGAILPVLALVMAWLRRPTQRALDNWALDNGLVRCDYCDEFIRPQAVIYRHCHQPRKAGDLARPAQR